MDTMPGKESIVIRRIRSAFLHLSVVLISLMLTACVAPAIAVTPSASATESPPPSPTPASETDRILTFHTERDTFTGAVLVARNTVGLLER